MPTDRLRNLVQHLDAPSLRSKQGNPLSEQTKAPAKAAFLSTVCRLVGHRRSKKLRRLVGYNWRSSCVLCGATLVRLDSGRWRTADQVRWVDPLQTDNGKVQPGEVPEAPTGELVQAETLRTNDYGRA
jgi:hypothetical protein